MRQQSWGYAQQQLPQRPARRLCFPRFLALGAGSWKPTFSPTMPRPLTQGKSEGITKVLHYGPQTKMEYMEKDEDFTAP